jgi:hypothetical protein
MLRIYGIYKIRATDFLGFKRFTFLLNPLKPALPAVFPFLARIEKRSWKKPKRLFFPLLRNYGHG